jgi:phage protein D
VDTAPEGRGAIFDNPGARARGFIPGHASDRVGFKQEIDAQDWIIAKAEHAIGDSGFTTQLELEAKIGDWIAETEQ